MHKYDHGLLYMILCKMLSFAHTSREGVWVCTIASDWRGIQIIIFISPRKHKLWVLIRSTTLWRNTLFSFIRIPHIFGA